MTICPVCKEDLKDPDGVLAAVLEHKNARAMLGDPWASGAEIAAARIVLGLPPLVPA